MATTSVSKAFYGSRIARKVAAAAESGDGDATFAGIWSPISRQPWLSFLTLAHALEKQPDEVNDGTQDEMGRAKGDTPGFFGRIYKVFVSSNNLAELAK